jgi:predicted peptidase
MTKGATTPREDPAINPNSIHDFHKARRGPRNIPAVVMALNESQSKAKDPGHPYAKTKHILFDFFDQRTSNASFGYEHYVSLPPAYDTDAARSWPMILFLHGAGESQRGTNESYASLRHGIPKVILCYDRLKDGKDPPSIDIPLAPRLRKTKQVKQGDNSIEHVPAEVCTVVAENFITITPSLNMEWGYGWNSSILSALLDEIVQRYRVDLDRIHVTGFSMGGYGTWDLALHTPNRFASLTPICGGGDSIRASQIKDIPQW